MVELRRSGRSRQVNKKYTVDPFTGLENVLYASDDSGSSDSTSLSSDSGEEFSANDSEKEFSADDSEKEFSADDIPDPPEDENLLPSVVSEGNSSREGSITDPGPEVVNEDIFIVGSESGQDRPTTAKKRQKDTRDYRPDPPLVHSRGISEFRIKGAKETRLIYTFGPSREDIAPILKARDKWQPDPTLPSLKADAYGVGGMAPSFYCAKGTTEREVCNSRKWYYEQGAKDAFTLRQETISLAAEDAVFYMPKPTLNHHSFLMGPYGNQKFYTLRTGERLSLNEPWTDPSNRNDSQHSGKLQRRGWILNLGNKIQNLEWLPNETGATQYLSISVLQKNTTGRSYKPFQNPKAPSFTPQRPFPASIQIWGFKSSEDDRLDPETPPNLELVICTDWGSVKNFKWCPVGMMDVIKANDDGIIHMGLLAGIWGDGKVRVLDIQYPKPTTSPFYLNIKQATFECQPPNTLCTCLTWLSGTTIAVGTANGSIAIWTLTPELLSNTTPNPRPWLYHTLNASYIVNITSAYPSRPHFLATSSADGFVRLTDIRSPHLDSVLSARSRVFGVAIAWHEWTQSFLTSDENYCLRNQPIRRFYMHMASMRAEAQILAIASSQVHPSVLIGTADGFILASNPIRRVLDMKTEPWQQVWFGHEWRRGMNAEETPENDASAAGAEDGVSATTPVTQPAEPSTPNALGPQIPSSSSTATTSRARPPLSALREPLSRITDGHKPETTQLQRAQGPNVQEGTRFATIYEEGTAVTQLAWNPNLRFGGWAAAGLGCGLVRVEDVAV